MESVWPLRVSSDAGLASATAAASWIWLLAAHTKLAAPSLPTVIEPQRASPELFSSDTMVLAVTAVVPV